MKFPLFSKKSAPLVSRNDRQAELERLLAQSFRSLGQLMSKMADFIDQSRLERQGYRGREHFLERVDPNAPEKKA